MIYKYWLPDKNGSKIEKTTQNNTVILVGANGSGKSKLGAWIEKNGMDEVHRIGGQRNLNFKENIQLRSYSEARDYLFYGHTEQHNKMAFRWGQGRTTTTLLNDYDYVLAGILALKNNENDSYINDCVKAEKENRIKPDVPKTTIDKLKEIWETVLPHRSITVDDSKFYACIENDEINKKYVATEMSDGERSVLYLVAQVLCVPENKIVIIDEPEIHLHRSIMNRLWRTLEKYRRDCLFIYITHDVDFAAAHTNADKYWVKSFDGSNRWEYEQVEPSDLPEALTLEILGSRKDVLFVEGEKNSLDYQLYSLLYPEYLVIPCGGCTQVIQRTKAFRNSTVLHNCTVYGLIDRDYRSQHEIESIRRDGIYTIGVAEVENLFLVEGVIKCIAKHLEMDAESVFSKVRSYVINERFKNEKERQVCESVVAEIKYRLSCIEISNKGDVEAKTSLENGLKNIDYDAIKEEKRLFFEKAENLGYAEMLKCFNRKDISKSVGHFLELDNNSYPERVIALLKGNVCNKQIERAIEEYLPREIPRNLKNRE